MAYHKKLAEVVSSNPPVHFFQSGKKYSINQAHLFTKDKPELSKRTIELN
jgi:hypothetical protein